MKAKSVRRRRRRQLRRLPSRRCPPRRATLALMQQRRCSASTCSSWASRGCCRCGGGAGRWMLSIQSIQTIQMLNVHWCCNIDERHLLLLCCRSLPRILRSCWAAPAVCYITLGASRRSRPLRCRPTFTSPWRQRQELLPLLLGWPAWAQHQLQQAGLWSQRKARFPAAVS